MSRAEKLSEAIDYLLTFVRRGEDVATVPVERWKTFRRLVEEADAEPTTPSPPPAPETCARCGKPVHLVASYHVDPDDDARCRAAPPAQEAGAPTRRLTIQEQRLADGWTVDVKGDAHPTAPEKTKPPAEDAGPCVNCGHVEGEHGKIGCSEALPFGPLCDCPVFRPRPSKSPGGGR